MGIGTLRTIIQCICNAFNESKTSTHKTQNIVDNEIKTLATFLCPMITKNNGFKFKKEEICLDVNEAYGQK